MRKFKLIGKYFPYWMRNKIVDVVVIGDEYYIPSQDITLAVCHDWEVEEVLIFNEYLKLIKQ